ncbi:DNA/RNA non-specific endonuclease [Dyadobacter endophyticus]|uniref:DNA/RNA non-specific endonuclease n=1 Tax=Dyadobacter endophyticus TaxID=1749036 RepID=UPI003CF0B7AD
MDKQRSAAIKQQMEMEALGRWRQQETKSAVSVKTVTTSEITRENNFELRETVRAAKGLTQISNELKAFEKKIGETLDFEKVAPHAVAKKAGTPVARLHAIIKNRVPDGFGTGFLVSEELLITNYHVFPRAEYAVDCAANFLFEYQDGGINRGLTFRLSPERFFYAFKDLDFALVAVAHEPHEGSQTLASLGFLKMIETPGKVVEGSPINIVQYPGGKEKEYAYRNNLLRHIITPEGFLQYETDTLSGSSGSPVFNEHWELVGLHHCGIPEVINKRIVNTRKEPWDGKNEDEVSWIANEGISISKIVEHLKTVSLQNQEQSQLLKRLLANVADPLLDTSVLSSNFDSINSTTMPVINPAGQFVFNFNGPTTVNFNLGPQPIPAVAVPTVPVKQNVPQQVAEEAKIRFDEDYDNREKKGYNPLFLEGHKIELPEVRQERRDEIYQVDGEDLILKYYHYSLVMNKKRRMMMWGALNADYNKKNKELTRKKLGTDDWRTDDRIPGMYQITRKELYDPAKNIDLGHIIRRDDSAWGDSDKEIEFANSDTFHYTNCTPQHEAFNQATPNGYDIHGIWGELENHIVSQLKVVGNKAIIFAGPVLDNAHDPKADFGSGKIQYPLKFWKIIVVNTEEDGLVSYGFVLDQTEVVEQFGLGIERLPDFSKFKKQQRKIQQISSTIKVDFDPEVIKGDVLTNTFMESTDGILFKSVDEIILKRAPNGI